VQTRDNALAMTPAALLQDPAKVEVEKLKRGVEPGRLACVARGGSGTSSNVLYLDTTSKLSCTGRATAEGR
jgi:hypothetical protein